MPADSSPQTWILLRGLTREAGHWGNFTAEFGHAFPDDEVLTIDLPGAGEFVGQSSPTTVEGIFNFVRAQAIARARHPRLALFAVSLGGMVAMEWMRQKADELNFCCLVNSSLQRFSPAYHRLRWQVWREVLRLLTVQSARERERGLLDLLMNSEAAKEAAWPAWTKIATERPMTYVNFFNQLLAAGRYQGLRTPPAVPTLLLSSLGDKLVDPSCSTELHRHMGWPVRRHPWGGHDLPWDDPRWVINETRAFVLASRHSL